MLIPLLAAMTAVPQGSPTPPKALENVHTLVTLGDSITQGGGGPTGYVTLLGKWLKALYPNQPIKIINSGISGHKSTDMQARFQRDVVIHKPELVTISVGVNDVWHGFYDNHPLGDGPRGIPAEVYRQKIQEMIDAAKAINCRVALLTPTVIHEKLDNVENAKLAGHIAEMKALAKSNGCLFIDLNAACQRAIKAYQKEAGLGQNLLTTDGVHMNPAGDRLMAWAILRGLGVSERDLKAAAK